MRHLLIATVLAVLAAACADEPAPAAEPLQVQHLYFEGGSPSDRGAWLASALAWDEQVGAELFVVHLDEPHAGQCGVLVKHVSGLDAEGYVSRDGCVVLVEYGRAAAAAYMTTPVLGELLGLEPGEIEGTVIPEDIVAKVRSRLPE